MIRITAVEKNPSEIVLLVEGRLLGPWVAELESAVAAVLSAADAAPNTVSIDVSAVSFVDEEGLNLLHRLVKQGLAIQAVSPFVRELLKI